MHIRTICSCRDYAKHCHKTPYLLLPLPTISFCSDTPPPPFNEPLLHYYPYLPASLFQPLSPPPSPPPPPPPPPPSPPPPLFQVVQFHVNPAYCFEVSINGTVLGKSPHLTTQFQHHLFKTTTKLGKRKKSRRRRRRGRRRRRRKRRRRKTWKRRRKRRRRRRRRRRGAKSNTEKEQHNVIQHYQLYTCTCNWTERITG